MTLSRRDLLLGGLAPLVGHIVGCVSKPRRATEPIACETPTAAPSSDVGHSVGLQQNIIRDLALSFGLAADEKATFDAGWDLYRRVTSFHGEKHHKELLYEVEMAARAELEAAMPRLKAAVDGKPPDAMGMKFVRREPIEGRRYVVFSDHHYTFHGHRTNFFGATANLEVYRDALAAYLDAGYHLVENGDVEDLVIFEPKRLPGEVERRSGMDLEQLRRRRQEYRLEQLQWILKDPGNRPMIEVLRRFDEDRRLIRVVGNHDYDLQRERFLEELHATYPNVGLPSDILLLERHPNASEPAIVTFAIMHGHQFDKATNPVTGPRIGETVSETLGLYFQGPDRNWRWSQDPVSSWACGARPLFNDLASGKVDLTKIQEPGIAEAFHHPQIHHIAEAYERFGGRVLDALLKNRIAFDYFVHRDPFTALRKEVIPGTRFFKYRLLDEDWIASELVRYFPDEATRPTLLFGHTHEARLDSWSAVHGGPFHYYLNSSSAGRFENLVWAIEIVDGRAMLVTWSRNPFAGGGVERRQWRSLQEGGAGWIVADQTPSAMPPRTNVSR